MRKYYIYKNTREEEDYISILQLYPLINLLNHRVNIISRWGRRSFIDPICRNSCMVLSMFQRLVLANSLFSLRDINLTLGLLPPRRHVAWRVSVGVENSRLGLKSECADIFHQSFLWLLRHNDEPQRGRNSCLWLQSRSVLCSFGVVLTNGRLRGGQLMSCRVNFHVVRSCYEN